LVASEFATGRRFDLGCRDD